MSDVNKENGINDPDQQPVEDLLRRMSLAEVPAQLDERVESLLRRRISRWTGPAWGFAAGVLATACVMGAISSAPHSPLPSPAPQPPAHAPVVTASSSPMLSVLVEPRRQVEQYTADVNGVPVTLERTDYQYLIWPAGGGGTPARVDIPQASTVQQVSQF